MVNCVTNCLSTHGFWLENVLIVTVSVACSVSVLIKLTATSVNSLTSDELISISIECSESPPSSGFSLLPTRRWGYPSGSVAWSHVKTSTQASGGLLCLPFTCDAHPFDAVSLDLPSDVVRASLSGVPNSFYLPGDRTHSSDEGVLRPSRRLHGPSRPDTALCPPISGDWRPVGPVHRLRDLSHCRQLGSSWPGL